MFKYFALISVLIFTACMPGTFTTQNDQFFNPVLIQANIEVLASDEFEGREAASRGEKLSSLYLAAELKKYGVKPYGDDDTYFQNFELEFTDFNENTIFEILDNDDTVLRNYKYKTDYCGYSSSRSDVDTVAEVVFAGYGIVAPEYNYNDYLDIDVKDKIVLIMSGEPMSEDSTFFAGTQSTRYSFSKAKQEAAIANGAKAMVTISTTRYPWPSVVAYLSRPKITLPDTNAEIKEPVKSIFSLAINYESLTELLDGTGMTYDSLQTIHENGMPMPKFSTSRKIRINYESKEPYLKPTRNVVGIIHGKDPVLKYEYVSLGAHYDHDGIREGVVYNGADDNASGTVGVLETARVFAATPPVKRSVLFIFYAAEEKGLFGSKYFAENYSEIGNVVVNINLDMIGRESIDTLYSVGSDKMSTELQKIEKAVNMKKNLFYLDFKYNDPNDPQRLYYRSDHINFVRKGIPSVFFFDDHEEDYHKPTDDADKINSQKIARVSELVYGIAEKVANLNHRLVVDVKEEGGH